jgi:hypothetical protein
MRDSQIFLQNFLRKNLSLDKLQMRPLRTERQSPLLPSFGDGLGRRLCGNDNLVGVCFPLITTLPLANDCVPTHTRHLRVKLIQLAVPCRLQHSNPLSSTHSCQVQESGSRGDCEGT